VWEVRSALIPAPQHYIPEGLSQMNPVHIFALYFHFGITLPLQFFQVEKFESLRTFKRKLLIWFLSQFHSNICPSLLLGILERIHFG